MKFDIQWEATKAKKGQIICTHWGPKTPKMTKLIVVMVNWFDYIIATDPKVGWDWVEATQALLMNLHLIK